MKRNGTKYGTKLTLTLSASQSYQCFVHDNMGWTINVKEQSFCDKYTEALKNVVINNAGLVGYVVGKAFGKLVDPLSPLLECVAQVARSWRQE